MFERTEKQPNLKKSEVRKAMRKRINPYQLKVLDRLTSGDDHWMWHARGGRIEFLVKHLQPLPIDQATAAKLLGTQTKGNQVTAEIYDGRWVAFCPDCGGSEVVEPREPIFVCLNPVCLNQLNDYFPREVKFPSKTQMKNICEVLLVRENPINRNWLQGESVDQLKSENKEKGLEEKTTVKEVDRWHGLRRAPAQQAT